jgi:transposase
LEWQDEYGILRTFFKHRRIAMDGVRKFKVRLDFGQRKRLEEIARNGRSPARKILRARILLMADEDHPEGRWHDKQIVKALGVHRNTVGRVRKRFVLEGEEPTLRRKERERPPVEPKLDGKAEAVLVAICCSSPPKGRTQWTLSLLTSELTRRGVVTSICRETVRKTLKKTNLSPGEKSGFASRSETRHDLSRKWKTSSTCTRRRTAKKSR